jgi:cob(I)alamin adenosyltransferase
MKIYTRTGDGGVTSLYDGSRVQKSEQIFDVLGTLDELGAHVGLLLSLSTKHTPYRQTLLYIQQSLLTIGSLVATPLGDDTLKQISDEDVKCIEDKIDDLDRSLTPLTNFLFMDGKTVPGSQAHICRTVCRRLEREMTRYGTVQGSANKFLNRLSDLFFTIARYESEYVHQFTVEVANAIKGVIAGAFLSYVAVLCLY